MRAIMPGTPSRPTDLPIVDAHPHFWAPAQSRCAWRGDTPPVPFRCGTFDAICAGLETIVADLPAADRRRLLHDNAARIDRLAGGSS